MAPERARGQGGHASDIFSVGAVFYELLGNRAPFSGEDPIEILDKLRTENPPRLSEVDPSLPAELEAIIERALQKDPARRFANLGQMRAELQILRRKRSENAERLRVDVQGSASSRAKTALEARWAGPGPTKPSPSSTSTPLSTGASAAAATTRIARLNSFWRVRMRSSRRSTAAGRRSRRRLRPGGPRLDRVSARCRAAARAARSAAPGRGAQGREQLEAFVGRRARPATLGTSRAASRCSVAEHAAPDGSAPRPRGCGAPRQAALAATRKGRRRARAIARRVSAR
jgi:hypothetical protein